MRAVLAERGTTVRAAVLRVLDDLDVPRLLRAAGTPDAAVTTLRRRLV
jgi:hypothetical protein